MADWPKHVERFIARDAVYAIGGGCVIGSFLYAFDRLTMADWPWIIYLWIAGIAYVIGYALQDSFSVMHLVGTVPTPQPRWVQRGLYRLFMRAKWKDTSAAVESLLDMEKSLTTSMKDGELAYFEYERVISLMHVGTALGPCCVVSAVILTASWLYDWTHQQRRLFDFDFWLLAATWVLAFIFCQLGWLKNLQWTRSLIDAHDNQRSGTSS